VFIYLLYLKDSFEVSSYSFKDRSKRTFFRFLTYYNVLEVFIKIFLLVILLFPFYNQSINVLQALQLT